MQPRTLPWLCAALACVAFAACESGWDVEGRVVTASAPDKDRALYIFFVDAKTIDAAALRAGAAVVAFDPLKAVAPVPADGVDFAIHEFGCHHGAVAIAAWAPPGPAPAGDEPPRRPFEPQAGDYFVASDVRHPYCGTRSNPEHITLTLDGTPYPGRP